MGKLFDGIDDKLRGWIEAQHLYFVATAPAATDGHVNLSPKGHMDTFAVLDEHTVAFLDLTGSGAETVAHVRENGRITVMLCAFEGQPRVVRLHGKGRVVTPRDGAEWARWSSVFPPRRNARSVVVVDVERVSDSCGFAVPLYSYVGERDLLEQWTDRRSDDEIATYQQKRNARSIDGLPALAP